VIPVVVHVIHNGEEVGQGVNISEEQIFSQIEVLNEDYRRLNPDTVNTPDMFKQVAVDTGIEFKLALRDPEGDPTNGIVRVRGQKDYWTLTADDALLKSQSFWPPEDYLNIWVCKTNYLGYAQFPITDLPGAIAPFDRETDGVIISYTAFGSSAKGDFPSLQSRYDLGRSTSHEIGHFLSLRHVWGDETNCIADDYCDDTPIAYEEHYNCEGIDPISCNSRDMYENFLDYSDDRFMNIFTIDQKSRMRTVLENSPRRKSLLTSPALIPPDGIDYDLYARQIIDPTDISCSENLTPSFIVQNVGAQLVDSFKVSYELNEQGIQDFMVKQALEPSELIQITIPVMEVPFGGNTINIEISEPNDTVDINPGNNTLEKVFLVDNKEELLPARTRFDQETLAGAGWSVYNPDQSVAWELKEYQMNLVIP